MAGEILDGMETLNILPPMSQVEFYQLHIQTSNDLAAAIETIDNPADALNFTAGLAEQAEKDGASDYMNSGAYARRVIGSSLEDQPDLDSSMKETWRRAIGLIVFGKETPGMWDCLLEQKKFATGSDYERVYYDERMYREARKAFMHANIRLAHLSGIDPAHYN